MTVTLERKNGEKRIIVSEIKREDLVRSANRFLQKYNPSQKIPVNIEYIIEHDLGIRIIPIPRLYREFAIRSYTDPSLTIIYIDEEEFDDAFSARVTIAHELAHILLHAEIFKNKDFTTPDDYIAFQDLLNKNTKGYVILERQARFFAPYVLLPRDNLKEFVAKKIKSFGGVNCMVLEHYQILVESIKQEYQVSKGCIQQQIINEFPDLYKSIINP